MKKSILMGIACLLAGVVSADVATLEQLQATNANVVYQYTFEGATDTNKLEQKVSPYEPDLVMYKNEDLHTSGDVTFVDGYDSSGKAVKTKTGWMSGGGRNTGAGVKTVSNLAFSASGTIEYLVKAVLNDDEGYAVRGYDSSPSSRWYFFFNGSSGTGKAMMMLGDASAADLIGGSTGMDYNTGNWYYIVQTWSVSGGNVTLNAWVANLNTASPTLTKTIHNTVKSHAGGLNTDLRFGSAADNYRYFNGEVDAMAIYDTVLDETTIGAHFNAVAPAPLTTNISAAFRSGQVFIQWDERLDNTENMRVYMHTDPITSNNFALAQLVEQRIESHSAEDWYENRNKIDHVYHDNVRGWIIEDNGAPLELSDGLFVHTVVEADPTNAYFAVLADSQNGADLAAGGNSMTTPTSIGVAPIKPIWQWGEDTVDWGSASNKPLAIYLHSHTSRPFTGGGGTLDYLIFGDKTMGWREGLPFKFNVRVLTNDNVVLLEPYDRVWINRHLTSAEAYNAYDQLYKHIESWHYGTNDKIYDPVLRASGTAVNYTERLHLWMLDWVKQTYQTDTNRVYAYGASMGTGVQRLATQNPRLFASVDVLVPILDWSHETLIAPRIAAPLGPMSMPTSDGMVLSNRMNLVRFMQDTTADMPHITIRAGRQDLAVGWDRVPSYIGAMQASRHGFLAGWDNGEHGTAMRNSISNFPDFWDYEYAVNHFSLNKSYPAFSNFSLDEDPGNGDPADGDLVGFINRGLDWSGIVDQPDRYEVTIQSTATNAYPVTVDVTLRNLQSFNPQPGQVLKVFSRDGNGTVVEEKDVTVDSNGLLTCGTFSITSTQGNTLTVAQPGFMFMLISQ